MRKIFSLILSFVIIITLTACHFNDNDESTGLPEGYDIQKELFIPELIDMTTDNSSFEITVDKTDFQFFDGFSTEVLSYNEQGYLGKTIKLKRGNTFYPTITNNIDEKTTIHWHGLEVNGDNDGAAGSIAIVNPGESKTYELAVDQQASTLWYHPHAFGTTAHQVYKGLAGFIIIEDDISESLGLPNEYGVNDIPVVLQAKLFDDEGNLSFGEGEEELDFEDPAGDNSVSTSGFAIMTNGSYNPYINVSNEVLRLRVLNGSNHGIMDISLSEGDLYVIGTDGGLLESTQQLSVKEIVAGQRYEILVDLSDNEIGDIIDVIANGQLVLSLRVTSSTTSTTSIPNELVQIEPYEEYNNQQITHTFNLNKDLINDTPFDPNVINEEFIMNEIYYFEINNKSWENHSFHIHNVQFLVVEIDGQEVDFREIGWKDTIYLRPGESMIIQAQFKHKGTFMLHCHILIHEENGMMLKFQVS